MSDRFNPTPISILTRNPDPNNEGVFILHKSFFLVEGVNYPRAGRCDNLSYTVVYPTYGTEYQHEAVSVGAESYSFSVPDPKIEYGKEWHQFIEVPGKFCFVLVKFEKEDENKNIINDDTILTGMNPGALWGAGSMIELFKIIREWSFMADSPFSLNHPMAIYSKMVFDTLQPPATVLSEIDSLPDMHLARFLKSDPNHRDRIENFPNMSDNMKDWFIEKINQYPKTTTRDKLRNLII